MNRFAETHDNMEDVIKTAEADRGPRITLEDCLCAIRQVNIEPERTEKKLVDSVMGKRGYEDGAYSDVTRNTYDEIKTQMRCMVCGERGLWLRDKPRCMQLVDEKKKRERQERPNKAFEKTHGLDEDRRKENSETRNDYLSFFRREGQSKTKH